MKEKSDDLLANWKNKQNIYQGFEPAACLIDNNCFCEEMRVGESVMQPANAYTGLFMSLLGGWILLKVWMQNLTEDRFYRVLYALCVIFMGIGTFLFHATFTWIHNVLDLTGMFAVTLASFLFVIFKSLNRTSKLAYTLIFISVLSLAIYLVYVYPPGRRYFFAITIFSLLGVVFYLKLKKYLVYWKYFFISLTLYALAQIIWVFDYNHIFCEPASWVQGHALWHVLSGFSCVFLYKFIFSLRTELIIKTSSFSIFQVIVS